jgi:hypothetical protein
MAMEFTQPLKQISARNLLVRFEVFVAVTVKNANFWDIKPEFVPRRKHITSSLQSSTG